jgi:NAD(P)H dehydrogenase (quinone)
VILVTGANGPYGRQVVQQLLSRVPAERVAVSVRAPSMSPFLQRGLSVRCGDFDRPETLAEAFSGAETVLINGTNYGATPADRERQQAAAITAAVRAGAQRVVITSWADIDHCPLGFVRDYPQTEHLVSEAAPSWTILRLTYGMAASLARDVNSAMRSGVLVAPAGAARATPASVADLAEATADVLLDDRHAGNTYELTGPDAIDWHDLAALAADQANRSVTYQPVSDEEFGVQMRTAGWPPALVDMLLEYYSAFRAGWANTPRPDLATILDRPAVTSREAVREGLAIFNPDGVTSARPAPNPHS